MPRGTGAPLSLWSVAPSAFLPSFAFDAGNGAVAPVIALTALAEGASPSVAAFMLALLGIGQVLGDIPAGALADRVGDRRAMMLACLPQLAALATCLVTRSVLLLGVALLAMGMASAVFSLGRQSYLADVVPPYKRARAMSTLGGAHRVGLFLGPFLGAGAVALAGLHAAYAVAIALTVSALLLLLLVTDLPSANGGTRPAIGSVSTRDILVRHWPTFATLGTSMLLMGAVRAARQTVIPLWAEHLAISAERTSIIFGIAGACEVLAFYPSGKIMDEYGRLMVAVPTLLILGGSMLVIPLTHDAATLTVTAAVMGLGNGLGSGVQSTLATDASPTNGRARFLSIFRLFADAGNAAGPVLVSLLAVVSTLAVGIVGIGIVGLLTAGTVIYSAPRHTPYATWRSTMAHRRRHSEMG